MLEVLLEQKRENRPFDLNLASRAAYTGLQHDIHRAKCKKNEVMYIMKQFKAIEKLAELFQTDYISKINPTGIEHSIWRMIGGAPVVLKIDLVDDDRKVTDFKFSRKMKSSRDALGSLQLSMYAVGMEIPRTSFITFKFPDLTKKTPWRPAIKEVVAKKNPGDLSWTEDVVAAFARSIIRDSKEGTEEAFGVCDPASWKCSPKFCDYWSMCRGKYDQKVSDVEQPGWIGQLFTGWNELGNAPSSGETNGKSNGKSSRYHNESTTSSKRNIIKPGWINDGFGTWSDQ